MLDVCVIARSLRTIAAVFRTAPGLNREQHAALHLIGRVVFPMHSRSTENERSEWFSIDGFDLGQSPIVAKRRH